jgi:hypothetical protein
MTDIPDALGLMKTARAALLADVLPELSGQQRYSALMIGNAMAIAAREIRLGPGSAQGETARLRKLLSDTPLQMTSTDELQALRRGVRSAIRAGHFDNPSMAARLTEDLLRTAEAWVAISNPKALRAPSAVKHEA